MYNKSIKEIQDTIKEFKKMLKYDEYLEYYYIRKSTEVLAIDFLIESLERRIFRTSHTREDLMLLAFINNNEVLLKSYVFKVI